MRLRPHPLIMFFSHLEVLLSDLHACEVYSLYLAALFFFLFFYLNASFSQTHLLTFSLVLTLCIFSINYRCTESIYFSLSAHLMTSGI